MMFGYFYLDYTILLIIPGIILAMWAQSRISSVHSQSTPGFSPITAGLPR